MRLNKARKRNEAGGEDLSGEVVVERRQIAPSFPCPRALFVEIQPQLEDISDWSALSVSIEETGDDHLATRRRLQVGRKVYIEWIL